MEFQGRIIRVLPTRSGTSQNGNEWKRLPFIFAYFENDDQRYEDRVLLETWDTNLMAQIAKFCEIGQDGKVVIENGSVKLKVLDIKCKCGFSHTTHEADKRDGSGKAIFNEIRCYKLEIDNIAAAPIPQTQAPFPPVQEGGKDDDLPF